MAEGVKKTMDLKSVFNFLNKKKSNEKARGLQELAHMRMFSNGLDTNDIDNSKDYTETIYFICLKHLSETMSKMPWEKRKVTSQKGREKVFDAKLDLLLNIRPNPYVTATQFWASIELNKIHYGNAYVYIETDKSTGYIKNLWQLPAKNMEVWINNSGILENKDAIWYVWTDERTSKRYSFNKEEILHFKSHFTFDGLVGMPIRNVLQAQINTGKHAVGFLNKFYKSGMFGSKILVYYNGVMEQKSEARLAEQFESFSSKSANGRIIPLPLGTQAQLLDMKLADAQFFENNKVSALQLAAAFGIKPNIINDYTNSSYSNSETQQLDFYVNTLQPLFRSYEQEMTEKLLRTDEKEKGLRLNINEKILFKMDSKTQSEVLTKYTTNFIMTANEAREELDLPFISSEEGGDKLIGNGNAITLDKAGEQYKTALKGGENNEQ